MNIMNLLKVTNNMTNSKVAMVALIAAQLNEIEGITAEYRHAVGSAIHKLTVEMLDANDNEATFSMKSNFDFDAEFTCNNGEHFEYNTHHLLTDEEDGIGNRDVHLDGERFDEIVECCCESLTDINVARHLMKLAYIVLNMDSLGDVKYKQLLQQHMSVHCCKLELDAGYVTHESIRLLTSIGVTVSYF